VTGEEGFAYILPMPDSMRSWAAGRSWYWRLPLFLVLASQAAKPLRTVEQWNVFTGINFGAHEFGHLFWAFFGEWMTIAGGSLTQLLIPIGAAAVVMRTRDWFGLAVCGLFLASSLGELSWYIGDARAQQLDLVSFSPDGGGHDWAYLLRKAGMMRHDLTLARLARALGFLLIVASSVLAVRLFWWMHTEPAPEASPAARDQRR
jgi:hypothetical protein